MEIHSPDPFLYTYCSLSTLSIIAKNGTLRFSDIRKSNDSKELIYGFNQVKKRLSALVSDNRELMRRMGEAVGKGWVEQSEVSSEYTPLFDEAISLCEEYASRFYAYFLKEYFDEDDLVSEDTFLDYCDFIVEQLGEISRTMKRERNGKPIDDASVQLLGERCLTLCFTGNGDLLSQWRGYGDNGRGVAVGYRRSDIQRFLSWWKQFESVSKTNPGHLKHGTVYYRDRDDSFTTITTHTMRHRKFMEERWELTRGNILRSDEINLCDLCIYDLLCPLLRHGLPSTNTTVARSRTLMRVFKTCKEYVPLFKQPLFYEEEEERLFIWMRGGKEVNSLSEYVSQSVGSVMSSNIGFASYLDLGALGNNAHPKKKGTDILGPAPTVPVGRIVIGPCCKATEHDIATLFYNYDKKPETIRSHVPYVG